MSALQQRSVGGTSLSTSILGLGCTNFGPYLDQHEASAVVHAALDHGVTYFDTADIYGLGTSEEMLGNALRGRRDEVLIGTKFGCPMGAEPGCSGASRRYVTSACEASLRRLGTDRIDLYWLHYPDPATSIDETLEALTTLVRDGKVRSIASSNLAGWQIAQADAVAVRRETERFIACQTEWNLLERTAEAEVVPACAHHRISVLAYSPLAFGLLTGKYRRGEDHPAGSRLARQSYAAKIATAHNFDRVEALTALAARYGLSLLDLALSWLASRGDVASIVAAATSPEQVAANVVAVSRELDSDLLALIDEISPAPAGQPTPPTFDAIRRGAEARTR